MQKSNPMSEESTFRKYACPKLTKIVGTFAGQCVSDFGTKPSSTGKIEF